MNARSALGRLRQGSLLLASAAAVGASCRGGPPDGAARWLLPPAEPAPPARAYAPEPASAIGNLSLDPGEPQMPRRPQDQPQDQLELTSLLSIVARTYPLLDIAEQRRVVAQARQLAALGNFDLNLRGFATSNALGFYQNETAGLMAEQPTGLWGATFYGGYRVGYGDFDPTFDGRRQTNRGGEFAAGMLLPLLRGGATDARRREVWGADIERDLAEADAAAMRLDVTREASEAYWRWVAAGRSLQVAGALLRLAEERQAGISTRVERGDLPEIEQTDNERLVVGRQALLVLARRGVDRAAIALSLFLRDRNGEPVIPAADRLPEFFPPPQPPRQELLERDVKLARSQRPELVRLLRLRDRLVIDRDFFANEALPRLDLRLEGSQDLDRLDPNPAKGEFELFVGVEMAIVIQNRRAAGQGAEVDSRLVQLFHETRLERDRVEARVRDDFSELLATYERAEQTARAAELAERVAVGERRRFALGDSTVLVLNLREEAAAEAQLRLIEAQRDYWIAVARYRAAVGEDPTLPLQRP